MTTQLVKIDGDYAYLFDDEAMRVFKIVVEDGSFAKTPHARTVAPALRSTLEGNLPSVLEEDAPPTPAPRKKRPSIMPASLRGVMLPADTPGAATETRRV